MLKRALQLIGALFLLPLCVVSALIVYWNLRRPPSFDVDPVVGLESWTGISAGKDPRRQHNSNTDLIYYRGAFTLVHAQTKWHLEDEKGALVVQRSSDARSWEETARITVLDTDVRDPKFAVIGGRLFLYFLPNLEFDPSPHTTYWTVSSDGERWQTPRELDTVTVTHREDGNTERVTEAGWKLWRPKSVDGKTWYVIASGRKPEYPRGITVLLRSTDGVSWQEVSEVYTAHSNGEPALEFLPDGSAVATLRCGSLGTAGYEFGNATGNTIIATALPPYTSWSYAHSFITRLDGATLFSLDGRIFAAGRNHLGPRTDMGNHLAKKRTAIYEVKRDGLVHLFDLPSNGDTAYTGVVVRGDEVTVSYYTCPIDKDYPWILGICFFPRTEIRIARMSAAGLLAYGDQVAEAQRVRDAAKGGL